MNWNRFDLAAFLVVLFSFLASLYYYAVLPDVIITHWNAQGVANGSMSKELGLFLLPAITLILFVFLKYLPKFDPFGKNYSAFQKEFDTFRLVLVAFMAYVHLLIISVNLGNSLNVIQLLSPGFFALFYSLGNLLPKTKRTYFIGIRTPWTLSDEVVWGKTQKLAGLLFKISAFIALAGFLLPNLALAFLIAPIIISSISLIAYSFAISKTSKALKKKSV